MASAAKGKTESWYVISSTRAQIVNLLPIVADGFKGLDNILVLLGTSKGRVEADRREAQESLSHFVRAIQHELKRRGVNKKLGTQWLEGDCDDLLFWQEQVPAWFREREAPCDILCNYTGGRKDMSIGVVLGLKELEKDPRFHCRYIAKHVSNLYFPFEQSRRENLGYPQNRLDMESYFLLHGLTEPDHLYQERISKQKQAGQRWEATEKLVRILRNAGDQSRIDQRLLMLAYLQNGTAFNVDRLVAGVVKNLGPNCDRQKLRNFAVDELQPFLKKHSFLSGGRIVDGDNYLTGAWFEEWVWGYFHKKLPHINGQIHLGLKLLLVETRDRQGSEQDFEFDVAIYAGDQLHGIECKNKNPGKRKEQINAALDRLQTAKRRLLGQFGMAHLYWCRGVDNQAHARTIARASFIGFSAGLEEIQQAMDDLVERFAEKQA